MAEPPIQVHTLLLGPLQACCYLLAADGCPEVVVIDPGGDEDLIAERLRLASLDPTHILLTHGHIDHTAGVAPLKRRYPEAQVAIHEGDSPMLTDGGAALATMVGLPFEPCEPDQLLAHGDKLPLGERAIEVLHTPGHTAGGVSFVVRRDDGPPVVFSGDTLFAGGIGRTDFPGGDFAQLIETIRTRLFPLGDPAIVFPGHGEPTTIGEERRTNPWLR